MRFFKDMEIMFFAEIKRYYRWKERIIWDVLFALMAFFSRTSKPKKAILFLSSAPIALSTNIIRIVSLSLVSEIYGASLATGIFHDIMGIMVFVFAFLGLLLVDKILEG